ncbi:excisionase family DNA binding protein [Nonomuraea polychroma]|uniref:Excisionase family DNA binding protein n=1 Tax=Nonomuraea polychroma TaxID=46176 RepID=A0A438MKC2_9ACTN|nr:helix-turn-helix domain-containing protein [Nonomuraea polychroma]RVX46038.1 excisionase family DNA binding protein [Nonomuraea polychroma]
MTSLALSVEEAAAQLRVSRWTLYKFIRSGQLKSFKAGRRRLIPASALNDLVDLLMEEAA